MGEDIDYNLAYIGSDFSQSEAGEFDKKYMNALFDYGYQQARHGYPWRKVPPGAEFLSRFWPLCSWLPCRELKRCCEVVFHSHCGG